MPAPGKMTSTRTKRYVTLLSVVLTAALAACGSDEPSGVTAPDRTASTPTETPASPTRTLSTPGSGDAPTATAMRSPAASGFAETDREALAALYNATDSENWNGSANWLSDAPSGEWHGVYTNDDGRVIRPDLSINFLSGEIPAELGSLSSLGDLYLYGNDLSGCVPGSLEDQLSSSSDLALLLKTRALSRGRTAYRPEGAPSACWLWRMASPRNGCQPLLPSGLPVDGGLTAPAHADALDRQTFSQR